ncbi:type II toxin-antitoxin system HipA family toxin [Pigmentiphaga aceris]|uniref:Type II toxin-antitoxin system HipA family toxin n=1 Tax=Pigmentiphaga aceris TaxID=1940612 RepID=A0A5C0AZ65_9BURK|nr:HipA domain-containing protein [Pigmentiphaga aceris]QEI07678.1 type II toxin-antitoxin system HipA family toxin [Pigmentiphaga aceris]
MTRLAIWLDDAPIGWVGHDPALNLFSFDYAGTWTAAKHAFAISPRLPLKKEPEQSPEKHSAEVRQFFENLLPEGEALDHAAQAYGISKANLVGLMFALGKETAGALRVLMEAGTAEDAADSPPVRAAVSDANQLRRVTQEELSERIRRRAERPFSVWDGKVRLSIAGYQDKIAIYERDSEWFLVEGPRLASTVIVKPVPARPALASLPYNEYFCMQLAQRVGVKAANTRVATVPEPVLLVSRFDRLERADRVERLHLIDGCQALGLPVSMKYERPYGDGVDVRNIRDGVTYAKLFDLIARFSMQPAIDKLALLQWVIFQVLIGNTDAHGKNLSFFVNAAGLTLAPAYDMVCVPALDDAQLGNTYAMAIGDAFTADALSAFEWASFAKDNGLSGALVGRQIKLLADLVLKALPGVGGDPVVPDAVKHRITEVVQENCARQLAMADMVAQVRAEDL